MINTQFLASFIILDSIPILIILFILYLIINTYPLLFRLYIIVMIIYNIIINKQFLLTYMGIAPFAMIFISILYRDIYIKGILLKIKNYNLNKKIIIMSIIIAFDIIIWPVLLFDVSMNFLPIKENI